MNSQIEFLRIHDIYIVMSWLGVVLIRTFLGALTNLADKGIFTNMNDIDQNLPQKIDIPVYSLSHTYVGGNGGHRPTRRSLKKNKLHFGKSTQIS